MAYTLSVYVPSGYSVHASGGASGTASGGTTTTFSNVSSRVTLTLSGLGSSETGDWSYVDSDGYVDGDTGDSYVVYYDSTISWVSISVSITSSGGGGGGGGGDDEDPEFSLSITADPSDGTQADVDGYFINGDASYSYARRVKITITGVGTYYVTAYETSGADSTFEDTITGLTAGTTYSWSAVLQYRSSGSWVDSGYTDSGRFTTSGGSTGSGYVWIYNNGWKKAIPYVYNNGWKQATPYVYNNGWKRGV